MQRPDCRLRFFVDDVQQGDGRAFGVAAALFPVAQGADGDHEQGCELGLGEARFFADFFDIDGRQRAQFGGGVVAFGMGQRIFETGHDFVERGGHGLILLFQALTMAAVMFLSALRSALVRLSFSFLANTASRYSGMASLW